MKNERRGVNLAGVRDIRCRVFQSKRPELFQKLPGEAPAVTMMTLAELGVALQKLGVNLHQVDGEQRPFLDHNGLLVPMNTVIRAYVAAELEAAPGAELVSANRRVIRSSGNVADATPESRSTGVEGNRGLGPTVDTGDSTSPGNIAKKNMQAELPDAPNVQAQRLKTAAVEAMWEKALFK